MIPWGGAAFAQSLTRLGSSTSTASSCNRWHGARLPLFKGLTAPLWLELVDAQTYNTGAALHVYRPALAAS
jgi:hypothetical protein